MRKTLCILLLLLAAGALFLGCEKSAANITSASPDTSYFVDSQSCMGCGACFDACPHNAIKYEGGRPTIIQSKCKRCGECVKVCPRDAIH
jgi:Fe-S-cluster-containing hydrogenase component 2